MTRDTDGWIWALLCGCRIKSCFLVDPCHGPTSSGTAIFRFIELPRLTSEHITPCNIGTTIQSHGPLSFVRLSLRSVTLKMNFSLIAAHRAFQLQNWPFFHASTHSLTQDSRLLIKLLKVCPATLAHLHLVFLQQVSSSWSLLWSYDCLKAQR